MAQAPDRRAPWPRPRVLTASTIGDQDVPIAGSMQERRRLEGLQSESRETVRRRSQNVQELTPRQIAQLAQSTEVTDDDLSLLTRDERTQYDVLVKGPLRRGWEGFRRTAIPVELLGMIPDIVRHPLRTGGIVGRGLMQAQEDEFGHALDAFKRGDVSAGAGSVAAGLFPGVGPGAADAGRRIAEGDIAGGVGEGLGMLAGFGLGPALRAVVPGTKFGPLDVPTTIAQRTRNPLLKPPLEFVQNIGERVITSAGFFRSLRRRQQAKIAEISDTLVDSFAPREVGGVATGGVGSRLQVGTEVRDAFHVAREALRKQSDELYEVIDQVVAPTRRSVPTTRQRASDRIVDPQGQPAMLTERVMTDIVEGGVWPSTKALKAESRILLRRIQESNKLIPERFTAQVKVLLEKISNADDTVPFTVMHDFRSQILGIARESGDTQLVGISNRLVPMAHDAMMSAAERSAIPGLAKSVRQADLMWKELRTTFDQQLAKKLIGTDAHPIPPETLSRVVQNADIDTLGEIIRVLPDDTVSQLRARVLRDLLDDVTTGEPIPGVAGAAGLQNAAATVLALERTGDAASLQMLDGSKLLKQLEPSARTNLRAKLGVLLGEGAVSDLTEIGRMAVRIKRSPGEGNTLIAAGINATIMSPVIGALTGFSRPWSMAAAGTAGTFAAIGAVMANPEGLKAVRNVFRSISTRNRRMTVFWTQRLNDITRRVAPEFNQEPVEIGP